MKIAKDFNTYNKEEFQLKKENAKKDGLPKIPSANIKLSFLFGLI